MAIVQNFWLQGASKRLAGAVLYEAMGQTRARQLATSVSNPRTESQMSQRVKWANMVNLYRANASWMKYAFETKKSNQSEYNKWMSLNVTSSRIYLTKPIAAAGGCVVDAYMCTQGTLPSIEWSSVEGGRASNIYVGPTFEITATTTVGDFASAIIANNPAIREGDQLSFIRMTQMLNSVSSAPYVLVRKYEVLMHPASQVLLYDMWPLDVVRILSVGNSRALGFVSVGQSGGYAVILSRTMAGKTYVSTQSIQLVSMDAFISAYSSDAALSAAIASYGESAEAFLSSNYAQMSSNIPVPLSLLGRLFNTGELSPTGTIQRAARSFAGVVQHYKFNAPLTGMLIGNITLLLVDRTEISATGAITQTDPSVLDITFPTEGLDENETLVEKVIITIDFTEYVYGYVTTAPDGGLE